MSYSHTSQSFGSILPTSLGVWDRVDEHCPWSRSDVFRKVHVAKLLTDFLGANGFSGCQVCRETAGKAPGYSLVGMNDVTRRMAEMCGGQSVWKKTS